MKKLLACSALVALTLGALTSCSVSPETASRQAAEELSTAKPKEANVPEVQEVKTDENGTIVTYNSLVKSEDEKTTKITPVDISIRVDSITLLQGDELKELLKTVPEASAEDAKNLEFYKINLTETFVSGENPQHQNVAENYRVVNKDGVELRGVNLIGFDWCKTNAFTPEFATGKANTNCILGAVALGDEAPAGVNWVQADSDYVEKPVTILLPEKTEKQILKESKTNGKTS